MVSDTFAIFSRHPSRRGPAQPYPCIICDLSLAIHLPPVRTDWASLKEALPG